MRGEPITLYGDGRQVRDILFVEDLVEALLLAQQQMDSIAGRAFNIGGGPEQAVSLVEVLELITELSGRPVVVEQDEWRPGDQRYYVSDIRQFQEATGWRPTIGPAAGVARLYEWLRESEVAPAVQSGHESAAARGPAARRGLGVAAAAAHARS